MVAAPATTDARVTNDARNRRFISTSGHLHTKRFANPTTHSPINSSDSTPQQRARLVTCWRRELHVDRGERDADVVHRRGRVAARAHQPREQRSREWGGDA